MTKSGAKHSFEIHTALDFAKKLLEEYNDFQKDSLSSRHAINCAMTAWHLIDWVWADHKSSISKLIVGSKRDDFQHHLFAQCPELEIMQGIANGSKHFRVDRKSGGKKVKSTKLHRGAFSSGFSREFDISLLEIELNDGSIVIFDDVLDTVVSFWNDFFKNTISVPI